MATLRGIDLSHYQSGLRLDHTDAAFVIVKATQGTTVADSTMTGFVNQAINSGLLWGTYHFASNSGNLTAEADYYLSRVNGYVGKGLMVLDWEAGNLGNVSGAKTWLDRVKAKTGVRPLIYMSQSTANGHDWNPVQDAGYELWVARYNDEIGPTGAWDNPRIWQYTDRYKTGGMAVDGDRFYGTASDWHRLAGRGGGGGGDEDPKAVWAETFAKWAPDSTTNAGEKVNAASQLNQARGYAEDFYDRAKAVQSQARKASDTADEILRRLS